MWVSDVSASLFIYTPVHGAKSIVTTKLHICTYHLQRLLKNKFWLTFSVCVYIYISLKSGLV